MNEAAQRVRTATVTYAVRDCELDNLHIHEGDIIGLYKRPDPHRGQQRTRCDARSDA